MRTIRSELSPAAMSQLLASLEQPGLLNRARSTNDRRRHDLTLSPAGQSTLRSAQKLVRGQLGTLLHDLPAPETDALARGLEILEALLTGTAPPPRPPRRHPPAATKLAAHPLAILSTVFSQQHPTRE